MGEDALRSSLLQIPPNTQKVIEAVRSASSLEGATYRYIAGKTGMTYGVVYKWARPALQAGYLYYLGGSRKGNVKYLFLSRKQHEGKLLPSPKEILTLHPELGLCRYVHPFIGRRKRVRAALPRKKQ